MRRWSAWTAASTWSQRTSCHDVISGVVVTVDPYLVACAALVRVAPIPRQAVPTSASSLSPGFPRGLRFLGNPPPARPAPDGLLPGGRGGRGLLRSCRPFAGRGRCPCCSPGPEWVASGGAEFPTPQAP